MCARHDDTKLFSSDPAPAAGPEPAAGHAVAGKVAQTARSRRLRLWELEERLHCPVIGTCLDIEDLKKLARKEGFNGKRFDHYRLHVEAVSASCSRNSAAEIMHRLLEKKYARWVRIFDAAKTDEAVRKLWIEHLARGEVAGAMWAALTHKVTSKETVSQVHGDVHMLSHQIGGGLAIDVRRLKTLETEFARLRHESRQQASRASQELSERQSRIRTLEEEGRRRDVAGAMWAALTHKVTSKETVSQVHGDVHMLSHQIGGGLAIDVRRLKTLETEFARLRHESRQQASRASQELSERQSRIRTLEEEGRRRDLALRELPALRARAEALESGQVVVDMSRRLLLLEATNARLEESLQKARQQMKLLEDRLAENARLKEQMDAVTSERDLMERLLLAGEPGLAADDGGCSGDCRQCEDRLKGRCVLCVGGRTTLLPQYRELAERLGVRLIHHDGGQEEAMSRLPELLAASDAVICPTDCVSHNAYYQLKRHCKTHGKPCVLTKSSGVAGFAMALTRLAEGKAGVSA